MSTLNFNMIFTAEKIMINDYCQYETATELWKQRIEATLEGELLFRIILYRM